MSWDERCSLLFEELRRPARAMVARAYRYLGNDEIDDIYASAWVGALSALRGREAEMDDDELRRYLLAAVANHAGKEMRRRSRRPAQSLDADPRLSAVEREQPTIEERVVEREEGSIARDLLSSLPERRRAVMLLRYGWGLRPKEVCAIVDGLSPRAYRKEIDRGVDELIERFAELESGDWCRSRRSLLRGHIAGTNDEDEDRQAREHLGHCRDCASFVKALRTDLKAIDGAGLLLVGGLGATGAAAAGGAGGAGAAGAGAVAKLAGLGAVGKTAMACIGTGAAATACLAAGVIPAPADVLDIGRAPGQEKRERPSLERQAELTAAAPLEELKPLLDEYEPAPAPAPDPQPSPSPSPDPSPDPPPEPDPAPAPSPPPPAPVDEFDPLVTAPAPTAPAPAKSTPPPPSGGGSSGSTTDAAAQEFGP